MHETYQNATGIDPMLFVDFFLALVCCILIVSCWRPIAVRVETFCLRLTRRAFFSSPQEWPKFAVLRIAFGIIITWRAHDMWVLLTAADHADPAVQFWALAALVSGIALSLGLASQYVLLFVMFGLWQRGDDILGTYSLASNMGNILSLLLLLVNAGRIYSLDGWLLRRWRMLSPLLLYYRDPPSAATIDMAKLIALFSYWLMCLYSFTRHLNEPAWMSGVAGPEILSSNFMSLYYRWFTDMYAAHQWAALFGRMALWLMLPWYLLMFPSVLAGGGPRRYAIGWGVLFFALSKFVLEVGWLAEIEFLIWAALFWRWGIVRLPAPSFKPDLVPNRWQRGIVVVALLQGLILGTAYIMALSAPSLGYKGWPNRLGEAAYFYGSGPINVFNMLDLRMVENWFTLDALEGTQQIRVPVFDENGARLAYHRSDRIYFGNTLRFRRRLIGTEGCDFLPQESTIKYLAEVYLAHNAKPPGTYYFRYTQYNQPMADPQQLRRNRYVRGVKSIRCELDFSVVNP